MCSSSLILFHNGQQPIKTHVSLQNWQEPTKLYVSFHNLQHRNNKRTWEAKFSSLILFPYRGIQCIISFYNGQLVGNKDVLFSFWSHRTLGLSLYIYIYIYVCVCVCVFLSLERVWRVRGASLQPHQDM
jgi:hypothetical protein